MKYLHCYTVFFTLPWIIFCLSFSIEKMFNHRTSHPRPSRCVAVRETALMFRLQMTETSNPKHGCVVQMHASVHCQPVGMLTDDAPDSSSLRCSPPPPPPPPVTFRLRQTPARSLTPPQNMRGNHGSTQPDYSPRTVIEYVTNTLRIALGNQIKKWIIYKDMECRSDRAERVEEYTYNIPQTTLQVWSWHFPL